MRRGSKRRRSGRARQLGRWALIALVGWVALTAALVFTLRFVNPPRTSVMLQRRLAAWRRDDDTFVLKQRWVALSRLPRHVGLAVVSSEDQRFFAHAGFDTVELAAAFDDYQHGEPLRGASTLSQQVAKNLFLWEGRSFLRKGLEAYFTCLLELMWSKQRILEVYLNIAEFGRGVFGVQAAAREHFDCDAKQLSVEQAALLAGILPSPLKRSARHPSAHVLRKQRWILAQLRVSGQAAARSD